MIDLRISLSIILFLSLAAGPALAQDRQSRLAEALERFPEADANGDGTLTMEEARAFLQKRKANRSGAKADAADAAVPPTHANVKYGPDDKNALDLWLIKSDRPTPLLICIHGGGFMGGDKQKFHSQVDLIHAMHDAGISVASINYRLTDGGKNPYPVPMQDGARAVQFLRYHAGRYNLDKTRFAATGGSAGGCMLMWLGFHDDLADPDNPDPVLRESTRLAALAPNGGQSTVHVPTLQEWFGARSLVEHPGLRPLFGIPPGVQIDFTGELDALSRDASPITHLTPDDPPIYLVYTRPNDPVTETTSPGAWVHHPRLGIKLKEAMDAMGIECHIQYPDGPPITAYPSQQAFLIAKLTQ